MCGWMRVDGLVWADRVRGHGAINSSLLFRSTDILLFPGQKMLNVVATANHFISMTIHIVLLHVKVNVHVQCFHQVNIKH